MSSLRKTSHKDDFGNPLREAVFDGGVELTLKEIVSRLNEQADEIKRLQAIVDKLPKTADDIPITDGMELFHKEAGSARAFLCVDELAEGKERIAAIIPWDHWYSTREAAEKVGGT